MKFTVFSDKGGRSENGDFIDSVVEDKICCFAAADGIGSKGGASAAARAAVGAVLKGFRENPEVSRDIIYGCVRAAQERVLALRRETPAFRDAAASLAVLITDGTSAIWASSGNCRLYIFRRAKISEVTDDHSAAFEEFLRGGLEYADIRTSPDRVRLRRVIGDELSWEADISDVVKINSSYSFLLCTDGFWENVYEEEMERTLRFSRSAKTWAERMLKYLYPRLAAGSDSFSAAAIKMQAGDAF